MGYPESCIQTGKGLPKDLWYYDLVWLDYLGKAVYFTGYAVAYMTLALIKG